MCDPVSIITSVVGAVVQGAMKPKQKDPEPPAAVTPPPQAQASKMADQQAARRGSDSGGAAFAGPASTMLTGNSGVTAESLNLGKNQLLGD